MILDTLSDLIPAAYLWVFGLSIAVSIALVMTILMDGNEVHFLSMMTLFSGFMVWGGVLEGWIFIAILVVFVLRITWEIKKQMVEGYK